jgi:hypothetical protein
MFNPDKNDYPSNEKGEPEFASIVLTIDGVSNNPELGDNVVQKYVLSTQDPIEALVNIATYFGEPGLFANPSNARILRESGSHSDPVFIYTTPREGTIQVITGTPTWDALVQHPKFGRTSALVATDKLVGIVAKVQADMQQFAGGFAPLLLLNLSPDDDDAPEVKSSDEGGLVEEAEAAGIHQEVAG